MRLIISIIAISLCVNACSKNDTEKSLIEQTADDSPPAQSFSGEVYHQLYGDEQIKIISADELELRTGGSNYICKYSVSGKQLRIVVDAAGAKQALYFEITGEGLEDDKGVFYSQSKYNAKLLGTCLNNARQIAIACRLFASDHSGSFPEHVRRLMPDYLSDAGIFACPFSAHREPIGYEYFGGKDSDPPKKLLLRANYASPDGRRVEAFVDGTAESKPSG